MFDVRRIREDFPMLKRVMNGHFLTYLDTAATAQKPQAVIDAVQKLYSEAYGTVHRAVYELAAHATEMYSAVRAKVKTYINAGEEEEIVFTRGTTEAINLVAQSYGRTFLQEGDEIILSEMEHHSNIVPWQLLAEDKKLTIQYIAINEDGTLNLDHYKSLLNEKTKLVSVGHISNVTGTINPIKEMIDLAHGIGAKVMIDGAQAASHLPLDMQMLDADFYAFSGHKMYGPTGIGVLYGKRALLEMMPPFMGGGDMIERVSLEGSTYQVPPLKFEAGTPSIAAAIGLGAAIDYITSLDLDAIAEWESKLLSYAEEKFKEVRGIKVFGTAKEKGPIISFTIDGVHPLDLGTFLGLKGIAVRTGHLCAEPTLKRFGVTALARISFGVYNTYEEIDLATLALREGEGLLKPLRAT